MKVGELIDRLSALCIDEPDRLDANIVAGLDLSPIEGGIFSTDGKMLNLAPISLHLQEGGF